MTRADWIRQLFQTIDNRDADAFSTFLAENVRFRFGNGEPANGRGAATVLVRGFFAGIKSISHEVQEMWEQPDAVICHGLVTYTRHDATTLTVPFANIFKLDGDLIEKYFIYADVSELFVTA